MANTPNQSDIDRVVKEFQERLFPRPETASARQIGIFIGGFPGSGKTTVAREISTEENLVHVQANDARVLLTEMGDFKWGEPEHSGVYVRRVLKLLLENLLYTSHSFVLDGAFLEKEEELARESLKRKFSLKMMLVGITCPLHTAESRAIARYADGKSSTFGDWRAMTDGKNDVQKHMKDMLPRREKLEEQLYLNREIRQLDNTGTIRELKQGIRLILRNFP